MATRVYVGVNNIARQVRKIYIGVNNVAKRVRKGYIGVAGVARLFFVGSGKIVFKETKSFETARYDLNAATVGNYAVFGPGRTGNAVRGGNYEAYSNSLTTSVISATGESVVSGYGAATIGNYAIFAGGTSDAGSSSNNYCVSSCTSINNSLTKAAMQTSLSKAKTGMGATSVGNYALFAGGEGRVATDTVDAFDPSLTKTTATALCLARSFLKGTTIQSLAVFAGGYTSNGASARWDSYNSSLTHSGWYLPSYVAMHDHAATTVGKYALFAGGEETDVLSRVIAINASGTASTATSLSQARRTLSATTLGDYAIFAGGTNDNYNDTVYTTIDTYDLSLTRESKISLTTGRKSLAAATIGKYALFGGGDTRSKLTYSSPSDVVDIYELTY